MGVGRVRHATHAQLSKTSKMACVVLRETAGVPRSLQLQIGTSYASRTRWDHHATRYCLTAHSFGASRATRPHRDCTGRYTLARRK